MLNLALKFWRGCFQRIFLFSPTASIDHTWEPLEKYIRNELKVDESEQVFFDTFDEKALERILDTQTKIIKWQKKHEPHAQLMQVLIIIDDFGSDSQIMKHSKVIDKLFTQGRHIGASTLLSQQRWRMASATQRSQATLTMFGRPRSLLDMDAYIEENSALAGGKKQLAELIKIATAEKFGFLTLDLLADKDKRWLKNFESYLVTS
jgi:hypothetical protein